MPPVTNHECTKSLTQESALKCKICVEKEVQSEPSYFRFIQLIEKKENIKKFKVYYYFL